MQTKKERGGPTEKPEEARFERREEGKRDSKNGGEEKKISD